MSDSITGHRPHRVSADSDRPQPPDTDIVYGELAGNLVLIRRAQAEELAATRRAVQDSTTWGDLRERLPEPRRAQIAEAFDGEDPPADDVALADVAVPGWDDGDWPEWPAQLMLDWVPESVRALGAEGETRLSGEYLELLPGRVDEVVAAMEAAGYSMERDDELVERASWS